MNGTTLKLIAIVSMVLDHIGTIFFPETIWLRLIGRLSLPIFVFLLVEGFTKTSNRIKYAQRLFFWGIISIVPHSLAFYDKLFCFNMQNIIITLLLTFIMFSFFDKVNKHSLLIKLTLLIIAAVLGVLLKFEYAVTCPLMAIIFYELRNKKLTALCCLFLTILIGYTIECYFIYDIRNWAAAALLAIMELVALLALIPLYFYNGKRGNLLPKYFFYWFYPIHLIVFYSIKMCIS